MKLKCLSQWLFLVLVVAPWPGAAQPCPFAPCNSVDECRKTAQWIVDATLAEVIDGGYRQSCETVMLSLTGSCGYAPQSPHLRLKDARIIKGRLDDLIHGRVEISPQASCFSGPLAMQSVPGNEAIGRRYRFYGNDAMNGLNKGFLIAEPLISGR